jgi:cytoskeleton protein RodZ
MIEHGQAQAPVAPAAAAAAGVPDGASAGFLLRRARESVGLHVAALAVSLKVPVRKLEALEEDRYDVLTDAVFVRALASSVCRSLKIDPQPVLERLPQMATPRLTPVTEGINAPFRAPGDGAPPTWLEQLTKPVFLAVFALLLGALVLILLPRAQQADAAAPGARAGDAPPATGAADPSLPPPAQALTTVVSPATVAAAPAAAVAMAQASVAPAAIAAGADTAGLVVFRTKAPSWVEVTDAKGVVAVRKMLASGEAAAASGALPLQVIIGRADATQVEVRGKPFDLAPVSRDNVARFEVR